MPTYTIDPTKIVDFQNLTVNNADDLDTTFAEIVTKHDLVANVIISTLLGDLTAPQQIMAIRAGVLG